MDAKRTETIFHHTCSEASCIEIAERVARSLDLAGDPEGDRLLEKIMLEVNWDYPEIFELPALKEFFKRTVSGDVDPDPNVLQG